MKIHTQRNNKVYIYLFHIFSHSLFFIQTTIMGRTRKNTSGDRRSLYKRTSISRTPDELVKRRVAINDSLRKKHREQLITAKRFRNLTRHEEYESAGEEEPLSEKNEHDGKNNKRKYTFIFH
jgi:hypothetical protein